MIRGTTPDYVLTVNADLTDKAVYVTISQAGVKVTLTNEDMTIVGGETSTIAIRLTQRQTLGLRAGAASVQVRFVDSEGYAQATEIKTLTVSPVLLERVIAYE